LAFAARRALSGLGLSALLPALLAALPGHRLGPLAGLLLPAALTRICLTRATLAAGTLILICHN
jgi:hypothetical protein